MAAATGASARSSSKRARRSVRFCASLAPRPDEIKSIIGVIGPAALEGGIKEGEKLRVLMAPAGIGHMQPLRVIIAGDSGISAAVALSDLGQYVPVDIRNIDTEVTDTGDDETDQTIPAASVFIRACGRRRCATMCRSR